MVTFDRRLYGVCGDSGPTRDLWLVSNQFDHGWNTALGEEERCIDIVQMLFTLYTWEAKRQMFRMALLTFHMIRVWSSPQDKYRLAQVFVPRSTPNGRWCRMFVPCSSHVVNRPCLLIQLNLSQTRSTQILTRMSVKEPVGIWTTASLLASSKWLGTGSSFLSDSVALLFLVKSTPALMIDNVPFELVFDCERDVLNAQSTHL